MRMILIIECQILNFDIKRNQVYSLHISNTVYRFLITLVSSETKTFYIIPNSWQVLVETIYEVISQLLFDNINARGENYFPFISVLFTFILFSNLIGLIPYSFTVTSHLVITFSLSISLFIGVNIIGFNIHSSKMISIFLPSNTSFGLALLLVPIEFVSYIFKPISLGVRLFANLMAGHTLLKVIVGFAWSMLLLDELLFCMHVIPLIVLIVLMGLELAVAVIQAYVFTILTCIYLNDSVNLH